jgi:hypothetical protein
MQSVPFLHRHRLGLSHQAQPWPSFCDTNKHHRKLDGIRHRLNHGGDMAADVAC